jgi:hypothetical protein
VNDPVSSITQCPSGQHTLAHKVCPGSGHWHVPLTQISAGWQPAKQPLQCSVVFRGTHLPVQQSSPSAHSLPQRPQFRRLKLTFVHAPRQQRSSGPQQVLRHLISLFGQGRPRPSGGAAQATPEMEAKAAPTRAAPMSRSALPRERVPSASPLASSSNAGSAAASSLVLRSPGSLSVIDLLSSPALPKTKTGCLYLSSRLRHWLRPPLKRPYFGTTFCASTRSICTVRIIHAGSRLAQHQGLKKSSREWTSDLFNSGQELGGL